MSALLDLLGRRWAMRVLWELRDGDGVTFRELQARCGNISSSVLNQRLRELEDADVVTTRAGYRLTGDGEALLEAVAPIEDWARRWAARRNGSP